MGGARGVPIPKVRGANLLFGLNCMKMKKLDPEGLATATTPTRSAPALVLIQLSRKNLIN